VGKGKGNCAEKQVRPICVRAEMPITKASDAQRGGAARDKGGAQEVVIITKDKGERGGKLTCVGD